MRNKLLMLKGLPASGKSTYAKQLVNHKGWKRVNKDDLRSMIDGGSWSKTNEEEIKSAEMMLVIDYVTKGHNVVIDSTNFVHEEKWRKVAEELGAEFEVEFFDVPLTECIARDATRGEKAVGEKVIYRMYEQYLKPKYTAHDPNLEDCYIFDIDGTLAHSVNRSPYDYTKVDTDVPNADIVRICKTLWATNAKIFIMSGRDSMCREQTLEWLKRHGIIHNGLYMRPQGDSRNDAIVKKELYEQNIKGVYNVLGVFDDRNRVVDLWRSLGLTCLQVAYGMF